MHISLLYRSIYLHTANLFNTSLFVLYLLRLENREKYTRSKSPNIFNRKTIEVSTAVNKTSGQPKQQQRARTASMPAENRKVIFFFHLCVLRLVIFKHQLVVSMFACVYK
jgi:hypothetical protein